MSVFRCKSYLSKAAATLLSIVGLLVSVPALATINTVTSWNGTSFISSFGVINTATYGQVITVFPTASPLNSFAFEIGNCTANVTLRGHVYAWNGTRATGASLWDGTPTTVNASATFQLVTFNVGSLNLPAGQYVLFASTSEDQGGAPASACRFGALTNDTTYGGGSFQYINNGTDTTQWTGSAWSVINEDLAFQVNGLDVASIPTPTLSQWGMIVLTALMAIAGVFGLRRSGRLS